MGGKHLATREAHGGSLISSGTTEQHHRCLALGWLQAAAGSDTAAELRHREGPDAGVGMLQAAFKVWEDNGVSERSDPSVVRKERRSGLAGRGDHGIGLISREARQDRGDFCRSGFRGGAEPEVVLDLVQSLSSRAARRGL